jgi:HPt (histidine-containing phosphotransfer) domain-containing protein
MSNEHEFEAQLGILREKFRERLVVYRDRLVEARNLYTQSADDEVIRKLKTISHELAGAGGTFGYPELSDLAAELEDATDGVLRGEEARNSVIAPLRQLIREVELSL